MVVSLWWKSYTTNGCLGLAMSQKYACQFKHHSIDLLKHIETEQKTETTKISIPPRPIFAASTFDLVDLGQVRFRGRGCFEASLTAVLLVHVVVVGSRLSHFPVGWTGESELLIGNSNIWPKKLRKIMINLTKTYGLSNCWGEHMSVSQKEDLWSGAVIQTWKILLMSLNQYCWWWFGLNHAKL